MGEFTFMEDWDLEAVVRGCSTNEAFADIMINNNPPSVLSPLSTLDQDDRQELLSSPDFFEFATKDFDYGVEKETYKPLLFYPNQQALSPQSILSPTSSMSIPSYDGQEPEKLQKKHLFSESDAPVSCSDDATPLASKSKRWKSAQNRVVKHVTADGLSSDMWAWRKYGQKPIKGSPYPRSYYRCSSLKGCLARKQVERSSSDPSIFIITYTAEHSHAHPTRRNSLAGSTRIKSSMAKQANKSSEPNKPTIKGECLDTVLPSSITPLSMASTNEDEMVQHVRLKNEEAEEERILEDSISNQEIVMPDIIFSDELFPSLEDFEGLFLDQFSATVP
ncbi:WRKY transcription factor 22 isoform X2 [Ricinus communis]|uniref:WRKY transcription factor 22 isoform X2 n=1 Tax=Ricinus communis TaxID=3988 RepID=UPI000D695423|nr:WRKY transcription factor 22 isoform X2 [Ricinus communis]|eukprot:XP_025013358.1 WRKY transcription factor 22 isoform X2 [Ricinus communis]